VVVVDSQIAASEALIMSMHVKEILKFKRSFLKRLKAEMEGDRSAWERFVIIKADAQEGIGMYPRTMPGASLLLDRHYNSMTSYRKGESNMYAVRKDGTCTIRYVETADSHLILRPHNPAYPIEIMALEGAQKPGNHIVGRVCHVGIDT
jgi:Peptidase S24-like